MNEPQHNGKQHSKPTADLCIVGGAGHVGLPLGIVFANHGLRVLLYDLNQNTLQKIKEGIVPFSEKGAEPLLRKALDAGTLTVSSDPADLSGIPTLIVTIGTPIDEFMNPVLKVIEGCMDDLLPYLADEQL